jgi:hypothetical protein
MRPRSWLAILATLALLVTACSGNSGNTSTPGDLVSTSESASASAEPSAEPSNEPSEEASAKPSVEPSEEPTGDELDYSLQPNFGSDDVTSGFTPDPFNAHVVSGGPIDASYLGDDCRGFATTAPDYDITFTSGSLSLLRFYFVAETADDTTIIINAPDGSWHCNDDATGTIDPQYDFEDPASGLYDIWIGSYESGASVSGTFYVTELESNHP